MLNQFLPKYNPSKNLKSKLLGTISDVAGDVGKTGVKCCYRRQIESKYEST